MFLLLETLVVAACYGAGRLARFRIGLALFGLLSIGALLGFFGQHYQTGADPWQLFALWSALSLPLAFASRSDLVWSAWVIVAMCAVSTWLMAQEGGMTMRHFVLRSWQPRQRLQFPWR